jgi:hypothetical protein
MNGLNLKRNIFDTILYEVDSSDIPRKLLQISYGEVQSKEVKRGRGWYRAIM